MTMLYLHGMLPSSPIQRKQAIKKLFEQNPEGVIPINNKYQIHLKYDKDLQKLIKDGFLKQIRQKIYKSYAGGWKKAGKSQSLLVLNPLYQKKAEI